MQKQITTHKGDIILLIEVPKDAYDFDIVMKEKMYIVFRTNGKVQEINTTRSTLKKYRIIGTSSTLNEKDVEPFVEKDKQDFYKEYNNITWAVYPYETALESWNSFLQHNGINLSKEWVVLKLLNNE